MKEEKITLSDIFITAGIKSLPINPMTAAADMGIKVVSYRSMSKNFGKSMEELYRTSSFGFSFVFENRYCIAVNENCCGECRQRFTVAHELGHCVTGDPERKLSADERRKAERNADRFAADFLAPLCVLNYCGVKSPGEISSLCGISRQAAEIRFRELTEARRRGGFLSDAEQRRIVMCFDDFITGYISLKG